MLKKKKEKVLSVCKLKAGSSKLSLYKILEIYGDLSWEAFKGDGVYLVLGRAKCATPNIYLLYERKTFCNCIVGKGA